MKFYIAAGAMLSIAFTLQAADRVIYRDWTRFPAVVEIDTPNDIYAIGDAHSDYARLARAMHGAGPIEAVPGSPAEARWAAGKAVLVVTAT